MGRVGDVLTSGLGDFGLRRLWGTPGLAPLTPFLILFGGMRNLQSEELQELVFGMRMVSY
jgi:hypothetical protein